MPENQEPAQDCPFTPEERDQRVADARKRANQDEWRNSWSRSWGYQPHIPCPDDILKIAKNDAIVHSAVERWRVGDLSWEQALTLMALELERRVRHLEDALFKKQLHEPRQVLLKGEEPILVNKELQ